MKEYEIDDELSKNAVRKLVTGQTQRRWVKAEKKGELSSFKPIAISTLWDGESMKITQAIKHNRVHYYAAESEHQKLRWGQDLKAKKVFAMGVINMEKIRARQAKKEAERNAEE